MTTIASTAVEPVRGSPACVEFVIRVTLTGSTSGCEVTGRVVGPRADGFTTVEVAYPLVPAGSADTSVSLKGVIPEPSRWTREAPFVYAWSVEVRANGEIADSRTGVLAFPAE